jgi:hypothetical protein
MHILVELAPLDPATGNRVTLRAASKQDRRMTNLNGVRWWPALTEMGPIRLPGFTGGFDTATQPGSVSLSLLIDKLANLDANARRFVWAGAGVTIYGGTPGAAWPWTTLFNGIVTANQSTGNQLQLTASVDDETFQRNILTAFYAGTTGAEGPSDLKNVAKPFLIGRCRNVEPILIDATNSVFQFHGYGPISAVNGLYERGSAFPAPIANYATYAALVAAVIAPGKWATCLAAGMVRLGAPPYGVITGDVDGDKPATTWFSKTGEIINRVATNAGVSAGDIDSTSLTALDTAVSTLTSGGGIIGLYLTEQESVIDFTSRLARACNHQAGVSNLGKLYVTKPVIGSPVATFDAQSRRQPGVYDSSELDVSPPYTRIEMTALRSWRVHTFDEIAASVTPVDLGNYAAGTTYREGNIVFQPTDGKRYYYISNTPTAGNAPPNVTYWTVFQNASGSSAWSAIVDDDGHKPDNDADVTLTHTASAITSQGSLATLNSLAYGSGFLTGFGSLAGLTSVSFGTPNLTVTPGGAAATLAAFQTSLGTAAAIASQGLLATLNAANWGTQISSRPANLAALGGTEGINNARLIGPNANRVPYSKFEKINPPWTNYNPNGIATGAPFTALGLGRSYFKQTFSATASGQLIALYLNEGYLTFPVTPGERLSCQIGLEAYGPIASVQSYVGFFDSSGAYLSGTEVVIASVSGVIGYNTKYRAFGTVPAGAVRARIIAYFNTSGAGAGGCVIIEPMVSGATQDQTLHPEFSPGPNAADAADITSQNTALAIISQGALATQNIAQWLTQVSGTGKPADYSTRNDDGDNMLEDPLKMSSWFVGNAPAAREDAGGSAGSGTPKDNFRIRLDGNNAWAGIQGKLIPVTPGEKLFAEYWVFRASAVGAAEIVMGFHYFDGSGAAGYLGGATAAYVLNPAAESWVKVSASFTVPNCSYIRPYFQRYNSGSGSSVYFAEPYIGRKQKGADITNANVALAVAGQGLLATLNLINSVGLLADLVVSNAKIADNAATKGGSFFHNYSGAQPSTQNVYTPINASIPPQIAVPSGGGSNQVVLIDCYMVANRQGGSNDSAIFRMLRTNDNVSIDGELSYSIVIQGINQPINLIFVDNAPIPNTTNNYRLEIFCFNRPQFYDVGIKWLAAKK